MPAALKKVILIHFLSVRVKLSKQQKTSTDYMGLHGLRAFWKLKESELHSMAIHELNIQKRNLTTP